MTVKEKLVYLFRNALIQYGREQGFKNPHESADKDIEEMLLFFLTHEKKVQRELVREILKRADILEHECSKDGDKGTEQWKAFKGFRNGIYDIANAKGLNIE